MVGHAGGVGGIVSAPQCDYVIGMGRGNTAGLKWRCPVPEMMVDTRQMFFTSGHFPVDLVLLALVAAFLVLRLRSVLGKKVGLQAPPLPIVPRPDMLARVVDAPVEAPEPASVACEVPGPGTRVGQLLQALTQQDASFSPQPFLANVSTVFPQVVMAYADGNRSVLQTYLVPAVYEIFDNAIKARDEAGEKQRTEIKSLRSLAIEDVRLNTREGVSTAMVDVRIVSDQISLVLDREGQPVTGTDAVTEFSDLWTFERVMGESSNGWRLAAARSA